MGGGPSNYKLSFTSNELEISSEDPLGREIWPFQFLVILHGFLILDDRGFPMLDQHGFPLLVNHEFLMFLDSQGCLILLDNHGLLIFTGCRLCRRLLQLPMIGCLDVLRLGKYKF